MQLTPIEIKNKSFSKGFNGYNKDEVKAFLTQVSKEIEELRSERVSLAQKVDELTTRVMGLEKHENLLKDTLVTAQKATTDIKDNARKECELLITKAKMDAENIKKDALEQIRKLQEKINELESYKINLIGQTKALITNVSVLLDKELSQKKG